MSSRGTARRFFIALAIGTLALAGCGSEKETADPGEEKEEAPLAYARCMREQGIDAPDPEPGERGFGFVQPEEGADETAFNKARDACRKKVETSFAFLDEDQAILFDNLFKFAKCMREKGVDFPDPDPEKDQGAGEYIKRVTSPGDPKFEEADDACRVVVFGGADQGPGGERGPEGGDDPS
jgi:hypothetical protein